MNLGRIERLQNVLKDPDDSAEQQLAKVGLVITSAAMSLFGAMWSVAYLLLHRPAAAMIPGCYSAVSLMSLGAYLLTRRYSLFRFSQILFILVLPFLLQWTLGGFGYSGAVAIWAFVAIVGALIFHGTRAAIGWFAAYVALMIGASLLDARFASHALPFSPGITRLFFSANLLGLSGIVFVVVRYAFIRRQLFSSFLAKEHNETLKSLAVANVNSARLISEIEAKNEMIEDAHRRLANSFDEVKKQHALEEIARKRMEAELVTARAVQAMLIPESTRWVEGVELAISYRSATECGGDWLGFFDDPLRGEISILIGDVTGHGVGSALVTAGVFGYFSTLRTLHGSDETTHPVRVLYDPSAILSHLDKLVGEMGKRRTCMTLFASVINYRQKRVRFSNAGHCFPMIIPRAQWESSRSGERTRTKYLLAQPGTLLGSTDQHDKSDFPTADVPVNTDDLLLWYTDGLLENRNETGEALGPRRLSRWLFELWDQPVDKIKAGLDARVDQFLDGQPLDDDIAYIVARVK